MELQSLPCYCATLRQAARAATSFYEQALADSGVRATQFTILQVLKAAPGIQTTEVATLIGMDQTTATRTLALMARNKLLENFTAADRRVRRWRLTPRGESLYRKVLPKWEWAQSIVERLLGRAETMALKKHAYHAANAFSAADEPARKRSG